MINAPTDISREEIVSSIALARRSYYSPIRGLTAQSLTAALDGFTAGDIAAAARLWYAMAERDDTIPGVKAKRELAVSLLPVTVLEETQADADAAGIHAKVLRDFWSNAKATSAWDRNIRGGSSLLIRQMMEAVSYRYGAHHIQWRPTVAGLRATFEHVPLWLFENRSGSLRFLDAGSGVEGKPLDDQNWLVSWGDGLMISGSIAYYAKRLAYQDWLTFSSRFSMPGVLGRTSAAKGTPEGNAMESAVESFGNDWASVIFGDDGSGKIDLIQANGNPSAMPMPALVERVDRKIAALYRGADLSTMSSAGGEGTGASLQGGEADLLLAGDALRLSELMQEIDRRVIAWTFGVGVEPLAYTTLAVPGGEDQKLKLEIVKTLVELGARIGEKETLESFGLAPVAEGDVALGSGGALGANAAQEDKIKDIVMEMVAMARKRDLVRMRQDLAEVATSNDVAGALQDFGKRLPEYVLDADEGIKLWEKLTAAAAFDGWTNFDKK